MVMSSPTLALVGEICLETRGLRSNHAIRHLHT